jgi:glycosyltransferase involved in cell wall biosynthesis
VRANGCEIAFAPLPYFVGPKQYILKARTVGQIANQAVTNAEAVILHIPSQIAASIQPGLCLRGHPYGVRVVGDPDQVFRPGTVDHPLRPFLRWWFTHNQKQQCRQAAAAAYVTERSLQAKYPPGSTTFSTSFANLSLSDEAFVSSSRSIDRKPNDLTLVTVGSLEQLYKGTDVLIDAVAQCVRDGLQLKLVIVGDGKFRAHLQARANGLGLNDRVHFVGQVSAGQAVRHYLDQADLFILPSRTEGLPRAMIEAMARALPCIGSTVGGIPELLPQENLFPPGDAHLLAEKVREVLSSPERLAVMSEHSLLQAQRYHQTQLHQRRLTFYQHVKDVTLRWQKSRAPYSLPPLQPTESP